MTACWGKSCSFSLSCVCFVNFCQYVLCSSFAFEFEGGLWGFGCIESWSLLSFILDWFTWLDLNIFRQITVNCLSIFRRLSNALTWYICRFVSTRRPSIIACQKLRSLEYSYITLCTLFNASWDNDFAFAKAHASACQLTTVCLILCLAFDQKPSKS